MLTPLEVRKTGHRDNELQNPVQVLEISTIHTRRQEVLLLQSFLKGENRILAGQTREDAVGQDQTSGNQKRQLCEKGPQNKGLFLRLLAKNRAEAIDQEQVGDLFPILFQLPADFMGNHASNRPARQEIGAADLDLTYGFDIGGGGFAWPGLPEVRVG